MKPISRVTVGAVGVYVTHGLWVSYSSGVTVLDSAITGIRGIGVFTVRHSVADGNAYGLDFTQGIGVSRVMIDGVTASKNRVSTPQQRRIKGDGLPLEGQ